MTGLPGRVRRLTISLAVWIQYMSVTEGRMDGHWLTTITVLTQRHVIISCYSLIRYVGRLAPVVCVFRLSLFVYFTCILTH